MSTSGSSKAPVRGTGIVLVTLAALAGCAVGPDFHRPAAPDADRYTVQPQSAGTVVADDHAQTFATGTALPADWWRLFGSAPLDALVRQALADNPTLQAAQASLGASQYNLRAGYGVFFPHLQADAAAARERATPAQEGLKTPGTVFNLVTLSGTVSYALDIFGGERRAVEGLKAQAQYQRYLTYAAALSLSANVVNASIARAAYQAEVRATQQLIDLQRQQLQAIEAQAHSGTAGYADVLAQQSLIAANQATLAPLQQKISQSEDLLATLEGVVPSRATLPDIDLMAISLPVDLPLSVPSALVRQRPDILASEAQLHAASAGIGVATAAMFPSVSLTGTYGAAGSGAATLSAANGRFWGIGPSATLPLFQGGRLWYGRKAAIEAYRAAQASYRQTVLDAFAQVGDSLQGLDHDAQALQAQVDAQRTAAAALELVQVDYRAGLASYVDVWTADIRFHEAIIGYLQATAVRYQDTVALFVALGGGWWNAPERAATHETP